MDVEKKITLKKPLLLNFLRRNYVRAVQIKRCDFGTFSFKYTLYSGKQYQELICRGERKSFIRALSSIDKPCKYGKITLDKDIAELILNTLGKYYPHFIDIVKPITIYDNDGLKITQSENECIIKKELRNIEKTGETEQYEFENIYDLEKVLAILINHCYKPDTETNPLVITSNRSRSMVEDEIDDGNVSYYDAEEYITLYSDKDTKMIRMTNTCVNIKSVINEFKRKDNEETTEIFNLSVVDVSKILQNLTIYREEIKKEMEI